MLYSYIICIIQLKKLGSRSTKEFCCFLDTAIMGPFKNLFSDSQESPRGLLLRIRDTTNKAVDLDLLSNSDLDLTTLICSITDRG